MLKIQSPSSRRPITNRLPIAPQLIADWSPWVGNHFPITRQYSINTRSLSAPEPVLNLFSVNSSYINLKAISWRQFYKRYFNHQSLKLTWMFTYLLFLSKFSGANDFHYRHVKCFFKSWCMLISNESPKHRIISPWMLCPCIMIPLNPGFSQSSCMFDMMYFRFR